MASQMSLTAIRQLARGMYGLEYSTTEDTLYIQTFMNKLINTAHHWFAGVTRCYYNPSVSLPITLGTGSYALDPTVIQPDERTFRINIAGTYTRLPCRFYHSLLEQFGPLESVANGTPTAFYIHAGNASGASKKIELLPIPNAAATLYYGAWVYPAELVNDTDLVTLDDPDVYRLLPAICWKMAEFDASRGRQDAPVEMWAKRALAEAMELNRIIRHGTREIQRTPEVGASPLADVDDRRRPAVIYGGGG